MLSRGQTGNNELHGLKKGLTVYPSMGTISTATLFCCLIDLDMWYVKRINIQTFHLNNKQIKFTSIRQDIHEVKKQASVYNITKINPGKVTTSALLSAFFSKSRINLADLAGQRPCPFEWRFLAWAVRPTPPQKRRKGIACLCAKTSSKYILALSKRIFRIENAVSLVFWDIE